MTREQINSLIKNLNKVSKLFDMYDHISISLSKEEVEYIVKQLQEHIELTHEEVINYCKERELTLISNLVLAKLLVKSEE